MRHVCVSILLYIGVLAPSLADDVSSADQIKVMAGGCVTCHGTAGKASGSIPALAGRPAEKLSSLLLAYKREAPADTTIMDRIAKGFRDEELVRLAEFFAGLEQK